MTLFRTSFWNGIAVAVRMGTALLLNKILAVYVGPGGYAILAQFQNVITMVITFATGAIHTGVTKYTAEHNGEEARQRSLWATAGSITLIASLASSAVIVAFRRPLADLLLNDVGLASVFLWLAGGLTMVGFNTLLLAILNGKKDLRRYLVSNVAGSLIGLCLTGILAWQYGLYGALVAVSINQSIVFFVTLFQISTASWFNFGLLFGPIDWAHLRNLSKFIAMAATTAVVSPLSLILIRNHIGESFGWDYAGYWDAMWRISMLYLTLVTTTLSLYFLPRISEIASWSELRSEIVGAYKLLLPLVAAASFGIYLLRDQIVRLLFTEDFLPMRSLFAWQMAGDVVKIGSWLLAYVMLGKAMTRLFIVTEVAFGVFFWLATLALTQWMGFRGVSAAHFVTYAIYMIVMYLFIFKRGDAVMAS